jgi:teichuronic acid biosynthesis glycosyltransferase TuaG
VNKNLEIAIILPNYNSSLFIEKTLNSIFSQSYKNWKLFLIDDNSDYKTKRILHRYKKNKKIKIFFLKSNKGAAYCRNFALKKIRSPYIAFIDSDDLWMKNKLQNQIQFMLKNNYEFSYTNYKTFGLKHKFVVPPKKFNFLNFTHNTSIGTSTMMVKKKVIENVGFSNTKICEDYYFKCKILKKINYAYCLGKFLTKYRIRQDSLQSNKLRNFYWIWKINKKYNNFNFFKNFKSLLSISFNSIKKYGFK